MRGALIHSLVFSCLGCFCAGAAVEPVASVPITSTRGQITIPARVNGSDPLTFMLDTGYTMTVLRPQIAESLNLRRAGSITVIGIAGEERTPTYEGAELDIGGVRLAPRRIGGMAATRRRRDGIIGSGLFRQYVVVIDGQARKVELFRPSEFTYSGNGEVIPLRFRRSTPIIEASINVPDKPPIRASFEIDTGCDSGLCLGEDFTRAHQLLGTNTQAGGKVGVGGGASTRSGHVPQLQIGALKVNQPDTDFFLDGSPVDGDAAGHIGIGVLRPFRMIFDYSRRQMILEVYDESPK